MRNRLPGRRDVIWWMALGLCMACEPAGGRDRQSIVVDRGVYNPAVSPDGETVAFGLLGGIWLLRADGDQAEQLTSGHGWDHHPAWSADGTMLAYVHDTPAASELVVRNFGTGTSHTVYGRSAAEVAPGTRSWGPVFSIGRIAFHPTDGRLYFIDFRRGIWSVDPTGPGAAPREFVAGSGRIGRPGVTDRSGFAFSPDGNTVVLEKDTTDLWSHLHASMVDSINFQQVTDVDSVRRTEVQWLDDRHVVAVEQHGGVEWLVVRTAVDGNEVRRFELGAFNGRELALYPDGQRALVVSGRQFVTVDLETGNQAVWPFQARVPVPSRSAADLVITNARLFDATGAEVMENATVEVSGGTIVAITSGASVPSSGGRVIDAEGRFLMPGLIEAHGHLYQGAHFSQSNVLARGITSMFDAGSYPSETLNLRDAINYGLLGGPHIYTSGPTIDGAEGRARPLTVANVTDPAVGRALVSEFHSLGVDAIKIYAFLAPDVLAAVVDEAHALSLPAVGDLVNTPWSVALASGIDGFVHVMDHKWKFISSQTPDPADGPWGVVPPDSAVMDAFFAQVAQAGAMFDPTVMASARHYTAAAFEEALASDNVDPRTSLNYARVTRDLIRAMHRNGVRWVAGTDIGSSRLVDELEIYEMIDIPNATVLQTATANVARWLRKDNFGTIEVGKRADMILVNGDPLERISDLRNVTLVVKEGRVAVER